MAEQRSIEEEAGAANSAALIERYHDLAVQTQNPVYLWLALEQVLARSVSPEAGSDPATISMPGWIGAYLHDAAVRINSLAAGGDYRVETPPVDMSIFYRDGNPMSLEEVLQSPELQEQGQTRSITPGKAVGVVPEALGFVQGTVNLFADFQATTSKMQEARFYEAVTLGGVRAKVALGAIQKGSTARGKSDRQIYARIEGAKKLF